MIDIKLSERLRTVATNVYPVVAPQRYERPAVIYNRIATATERDIDQDEQTAGWVTFQIDVYDTAHKTAKTLSRAIRTSLKAWQDDSFQTVVWASEVDMVDDTTDTLLFRTMATYRIFVTDGI